jgi:hypothetical protein
VPGRFGSAIESGRDPLVRAVGRPGEVPCVPIGLACGVGCVRQRAVRRAPVVLLSGAVDRRARERVAEIHACPQRHEPGLFGRLQVSGVEPQDGERAREGAQLADLTCGDDQDGAPRRTR